MPDESCLYNTLYSLGKCIYNEFKECRKYNYMKNKSFKTLIEEVLESNHNRLVLKKYTNISDLVWYNEDATHRFSLAVYIATKKHINYKINSTVDSIMLSKDVASTIVKEYDIFILNETDEDLSPIFNNYDIILEKYKKYFIMSFKTCNYRNRDIINFLNGNNNVLYYNKHILDAIHNRKIF